RPRRVRRPRPAPPPRRPPPPRLAATPATSKHLKVLFLRSTHCEQCRRGNYSAPWEALLAPDRRPPLRLGGGPQRFELNLTAGSWLQRSSPPSHSPHRPGGRSWTGMLPATLAPVAAINVHQKNRTARRVVSGVVSGMSNSIPSVRPNPG